MNDLVCLFMSKEKRLQQHAILSSSTYQGTNRIQLASFYLFLLFFCLTMLLLKRNGIDFCSELAVFLLFSFWFSSSSYSTSFPSSLSAFSFLFSFFLFNFSPIVDILLKLVSVFLPNLGLVISFLFPLHLKSFFLSLSPSLWAKFLGFYLLFD